MPNSPKSEGLCGQEHWKNGYKIILPKEFFHNMLMWGIKHLLVIVN